MGRWQLQPNPRNAHTATQAAPRRAQGIYPLFQVLLQQVVLAHSSNSTWGRTGLPYSLFAPSHQSYLIAQWPRFISRQVTLDGVPTIFW